MTVTVAPAVTARNMRSDGRISVLRARFLTRTIYASPGGPIRPAWRHGAHIRVMAAVPPHATRPSNPTDRASRCLGMVRRMHGAHPDRQPVPGVDHGDDDRQI